MKFAPMAIPAVALLQQHDARRNIAIEPAARRRAAIEAQGHSELGAFGTGDVRNCGRNRAVKTHQLVCLSVCQSVFFFPCLISATAHWMSTILPHMVWP